MNILNRYILKQFLRPFFASFLALCILLFLTDLFENLDRFLAGGVNFKYVAGFLLTSLPYKALQVLPVACLLATLFVVGTLARTREYIAGLAGGIPPEKFLGGILLAGALASVVALVANETLVPPFTRYAETVYREKIRRLGEWRQSYYVDLFVKGAEGRFWSVKRFDERSGRMNRVVVDTYDSGRLVGQIDAEQADWDGQNWIFFNGTVRVFSDDNVDIQSREPFQKKSFAFQEKPSDLVTQEPQPEQMNYKSLEYHIRRLKSLGVPMRKMEVELMMKVAFPFSCFVVTFLGVPLSMRGKGNRAMGIATGAAVALIYLGSVQIGQVLAQKFIPPWAGAWMSNILFFLAGSYLWWRMRRTA